MGLLDAFKKKEEIVSKPRSEAERQKAAAEEDRPQGKYSEACSACGGSGTDKKWMGQYWHKKCLRAAKRQAKGMV